MTLYDTHIHVDVLCEKLGLIQSPVPEHASVEDAFRWCEENRISHEHLVECSRFFAQHDFAIHATISPTNAYICHTLFSSLKPLFFLEGAHPEIVHETFSVEEFLSLQQAYDAQYTDYPFVGIGEIGLDYYYSSSPLIHALQKELCISQIQRAQQKKMPVVFHVRDAFDDFFTLIDTYTPRYGFEVHCFTGNSHDAQGIVDRGGKVGIGGIITFKKSDQLRNAISHIPLSSCILETDAPFLAPAPYRGKICMPEYVYETAKILASLQGVTVEQCIYETRKTACALFNLPEIR